MELLTFDNVVFKTYVFWAAVLTIKILLMSALTSIKRGKAKVLYSWPKYVIITYFDCFQAFCNPEDAAYFKIKEIKFGDPDVERVRRAHRNDLENVLPLLIIGFLYVLIDPPAWLAISLFRLAALARISHTLVYAVWVLPQPSRGYSYAVGAVISIYMALHIIWFTL